MFFNLAWKNARRSRRENLIYFITLVTAAASFYVVMSLEKQDVIQFLATIERDAVQRLLRLLMPTVYLCALLLLFFLVFFANKYQLECRSREMGLYFLLGMKRGRLFVQILLENLLTGLAALCGGLASGIFLSEILSLASARLVGQGIIAHEACISLRSMAWTVLGFLAVQAAAICILGGRLFAAELHSLLYGKMSKKQNAGTLKGSIATLIIGGAALTAAYVIVIRCFTMAGGMMLYAAVLTGIIGTVLFIRGLSRVIRLGAGYIRRPFSRGLFIFTLRQFQENIVNKYIAVSAASILIMLAIMLITDGSSGILINKSQLTRTYAVYDFTITGNNAAARDFLTSEAMAPYVSQLNPMETGAISSPEDDSASVLDWSALETVIWENLTPEEKNVAENAVNFSFDPATSPALNLYGLFATGGEDPKLIPVSAYNRLLAAAGEKTIHLEDDQAAFYINSDFLDVVLDDLTAFLDRCITDSKEPLLYFNGNPVYLIPCVPMKGITADENIQIFTGLIVPDALFYENTHEESRMTYWNFCVPQAMADQKGLMGSIMEICDILNTSGLTYESYLNNFGRQLFYIISGSYTALYMGFMFLIIACALLALEFLTQMQTTMDRYKTLAILGTQRSQMKRSLHHQVLIFFLLPAGLACISAAAGLYAMQIHLHTFSDHKAMLHPLMLVMAAAVLAILAIYTFAVARTGDRAIAKI